MKTLTRKIRKALLALCLFLVAYDFVSFSNRAASLSDTELAIAEFDAIIALTGGRNRIFLAAQIAQNRNLPLFISGVHEDAKPKEVADAAGVDPAFFECCATLGYFAHTTHENGLEVAKWADQFGFGRLVIVTSNYHMERALIELQQAMPEAKLYSHAVASPTIHADAWWRDTSSAKRMLVEWSKWRIVKTKAGFN